MNGAHRNRHFKTGIQPILILHPGIKRDDLDYLKEIISKLGGWPVVEGHRWNETNNSWITFIDEAKHIAFFYYYFYGLRSRSINDRTTIFFQPIDLEFSGGNMTNPQNHKMVVPYLNFMVDVASLLGANETHSKEELAPLVAFELQIADIKMQNDISLSSNKNNQIELSVTKVIEKWPSIDWIKLVNTRSDLSRNISNETVIFIENTDVITKLDNLVKNTTARVRANYAMWKTIQYLIPMVESASLSRLSLIYNKIKDPSYVHATFDCLKELKRLFPELMLAYYGRNSPIGKRAKIQIQQLISFVEQQFFDTLNSTKWLDVKTRDGLFQALKSLKLRIGYPDEIMDDRKLKEYFQGLNITHDNFLRNFVNRKVFTAKKVYNFDHMPQNSIGFMDNFYTFTLFEGDAFFNPRTNTIVLGVELLRNLFFSIHRPNYVNIALLGDKLAHEIGHSIDHPYDIYESKANNSKWSESSKQKYHDIRECIAEQYSNYSSKVTGKKVDGGFYLQENIADIIGVQVAYSTYQDWVKTHGQGRTFSSLPYNTNQLFWLSFANQWCWPKSTLRNWNSNDEHPSPAHRVIVPLFNSPEFSKDFNCPSGSNMNPVKKCIVF
ncbi:neprilysin-2-like [Microplitis mediator]|uniref:neprilysin-2-like n=1 Tax=Microplitis mediator TaxID=375433 RepID=UPI002556101B|nr:neprilysin-2-like [Microplitis mediator]